MSQPLPPGFDANDPQHLQRWQELQYLVQQQSIARPNTTAPGPSADARSADEEMAEPLESHAVGHTPPTPGSVTSDSGTRLPKFRIKESSVFRGNINHRDLHTFNEWVRSVRYYFQMLGFFKLDCRLTETERIMLTGSYLKGAAQRHWVGLITQTSHMMLAVQAFNRDITHI